MNRDPAAWSIRSLAARGEIVELVDASGRRIVLTTRTEGQRVADLHNRVVDDAIAAAKEDSAERATVGDIEALLVRVVVAALKELARGCLPRRLRPCPPPVRRPVRSS